ncbi:hypothetical protein FACS1894152_2710 [Bacilli bacterium]|nr:hypothetical protein FACS1894152_2710 [Bacilli bacterium]
MSNFSFALSDFKEIHVQRSADLEEWADGIEANAGEIKIPGIDPIAIYHVGKLIADLNDDGSQGNPTAIKINLGPD